MKTQYKKTLIVVITAILIYILSFCAVADTNAKGFSIYRQGNIPNPSGHAGIVGNSSVDLYNSIIHIIKGADTRVRKTSLTEFIDEQELYGYYVPTTLKNYSSQDRTNMINNIINKANALATLTNDVLSYNVLHQVYYHNDINNNGKVDISEISSMRCDGLVEYCYESYGFIVYYGNISTYNTAIRNEHRAPNITPKQQIKYYLQNCLGDVDGDLEVTADDSRLALRYSVGSEIFDSYQFFVADVDGDSSVTVADARLILRYSTGLDTTFPSDPYPSL